MTSSIRSLLGILVLATVLFATTGCTAVKVAVTPLTVVRDVVDAPLVSLTNVNLYFARQTQIAKAPGAGVGWSWKGGFNFGIGYDVSHLLFMGLAGVFGAVDYVICRSLYPNFPDGVSPWKAREQSWGSLYFPNTRVLWGDERPIYRKPEESPPPPPQ